MILDPCRPPGPRRVQLSCPARAGLLTCSHAWQGLPAPSPSHPCPSLSVVTRRTPLRPFAPLSLLGIPKRNTISSVMVFNFLKSVVMLHGMSWDFLSDILLGLTCTAPGTTVQLTYPLGGLWCPGSCWAVPRAAMATWRGRPLSVQPPPHARRRGWCRSASGPRALTGDSCTVETPGLLWAHPTCSGPVPAYGSGIE